MKIVIRSDASRWIGSGHIMRCLVLAKALAEDSHSVYFACLPQTGDLISLIEGRGYEVIRLSKVSNPKLPKSDADYAAWLQRSEEIDARDFIEHVKSADLVVTDHYGIGSLWQSNVRNYLQCDIFAIDDLVRQHDADYILDQTLGRESREYTSKGIVMTGSQYALLSPKFHTAREVALERETLPMRPKVLVSMGGIDEPNATLKVLKALVGHINAAYTVLLSPRSPNYEEVRNWCAEFPEVTHVDFTENMPSMMLQHHIAIGAPGTTSWERACLGLPSIIIPLAENQNTISEQLVKNKAVLAVALDEIESSLLGSYDLLTSNWQKYVANNLVLCDGLGIKRIISELYGSRDNEGENQYILDIAKNEDIELVFEWQCHPETRRYALNPQNPNFEQHVRWMKDKLARVSDYFYLIKDMSKEKSLGAVRLDRIRKGHYLISIFIAPDNYGKGIASSALKTIDKMYEDVTLHATVLHDNKASQRLFEKSKFKRISKETFIREPKK
ncbi:UDP-2,4-diacetamido-2,4,6-trideoxy-beta-L-altropyranose hydrolase [Enterovibrio norvegicus FF-162]|uniref:UDP-2,4-diacetamido-2,4, 6-trideoxy-beta-L-altropyranose hydrolase n=1 Tax=Enterovibrio norvegicus TaxID=188144 RepID=UPI00030C8374|nr:UDP-2,4-diacetamido-2,4,6-trideoxy-beta-L-altropyranose hydrolase [Enterovibrio norvegicus]OEE83856.1 UDP-2,4-diacetamido-2,4,6-trideoxy-beta-L-altropyranose hydrolase [Enterovibrio norvegicus FF-162]